jgi:hypothetical protein
MKKDANLLDTVRDLLGVLRTLYHAVAAKDTFVSDDMRLTSRKADGFDGTLSDTTEAGFTV